MHCYLCSCWRLSYIAHDPSVVAGRVCMESSWIFIRHFWLNERNGSAKCRPRSSRSLVRWMFLSQRVTKGTVEHSANCLYSFDVINIRHRINYHHDLTATKPKMTKKQQVEKKDQQMFWFGAFSGHLSPGFVLLFMHVTNVHKYMQASPVELVSFTNPVPTKQLRGNFWKWLQLVRILCKSDAKSFSILFLVRKRPQSSVYFDNDLKSQRIIGEKYFSAILT